MSTNHPQIVSGQTELTRPELGTRYPALDGLRAVAFLMVFLSHYEGVDWMQLGVNFFFVLSGFLITGILWDGRDRPRRARTFYLRRTLRVFPLYYGMGLLVVGLYPLFRWEWDRRWWAWVFYLGNTLRLPEQFNMTKAADFAAAGHLVSPNHLSISLFLGHFWSLCVEEQFYLFWPLIVWQMRSRRVLMTLATCVVAGFPLLRHELATHFTWAVPVVLWTSFQFDGLILGGLIALLWRGAHRRLMIQVSAVVLALMTLVGLCAAVHAYHGSFGYFCHEHSYPAWYWRYGMLVGNAYGACLLLQALQPGSWVYRLLIQKPLRWLGVISYGAYVFHDAWHSVYDNLISHLGNHLRWVRHYERGLTAFLALAVTLALAHLSYNTFEAYFLSLKERIAPTSAI